LQIYHNNILIHDYKSNVTLYQNKITECTRELTYQIYWGCSCQKEPTSLGDSHLERGRLQPSWLHPLSQLTTDKRQQQQLTPHSIVTINLLQKITLY